ARIDKLIAFLPSPIGVGLDAADRVLLEQQLVMMNGYAKILRARIKRF
ncbi:MAG: hypothetical protein GY925_19260, partial [Actinomycetia bacterium]|nr:hypothetical protein [Actinomycetes bacterium]